MSAYKFRLKGLWGLVGADGSFEALSRRNATSVARRFGDTQQTRGLMQRGQGASLSSRKRAFDLVLALLLIVPLSPVLAAVWITIRATSRGPGLFWSERVGLRNRPFMMPKFRTMGVGAPLSAREALPCADDHITLIGKLLRRYSLDELPQLFSIISGDMSFVGPRPLIPDDPAQSARAKFPNVLSVRPGLSGLAQVRGRNLVSPRRKARLDALYARTRSWRLDLKIIAATFVVLLTGKGFT